MTTAETFQLAPYQAAYLHDRSHRKLVVKSRRIGFSWIAALEAACDACGFDPVSFEYKPETGIHYRLASATQLQARDLLATVGDHLRNLENATGLKLISRKGALRDVIHLRNGKRIEAMAANARRMRGGQGGLLLDEFGAMPFSDDVWQAAMPSAGRHLGNAKGYPIRVVGTPLGDSNKFARLALTGEGDGFERYRVDVHEAIKQGFPADLEELRRDMPDPERFGQEYECSFLAASGRLIAESSYDSCTYDPSEYPSPEAVGQRFAGFDVARAARGDKCAAVTVERAGDVLWVPTDGVDARRGVSFDVQEEWIGGLVKTCARVTLDSTGIGMQLGERMQSRHGSAVVPLTFSMAVKADLASELVTAFARRAVRVPDDPELRRDVLSLRRKITEAGNELVVAERKMGSHADAAWALAMALYSARKPRLERVEYSGWQSPDSSGVGRWFHETAPDHGLDHDARSLEATVNPRRVRRSKWAF